MHYSLVLLLALVAAPLFSYTETTNYTKPTPAQVAKLNPLQRYVTQQNGTEPPFINSYWNTKQAGIYVDVLSGEPLFSSADKYDSGTGWPSFSKPIAPAAVREVTDSTHGMTRVEIRSTIADSHLGHVFTDGPIDQGGLRYCMNSAALRFIPRAQMAAAGYADWLAHVPE